ncbi:MAG: hypothetical protein ACXVFU_12805 [Nocardioidaceae bacterium]
MSRSFFARGLAASAVAALAVTGLATPARADTGLSVHLISQFTGKASTKQDSDDSAGSSTRVTLTAEASLAATVLFSYRAAGADGGAPWTDIAAGMTPSVAGYVSTDWTPPSTGTFDVRVAATDGTSTVADQRLAVQVGSSAQAVELSPGVLPYFTQPYASVGKTSSSVVVSGTTSATDGTVAISWWDSADGTFHGQTNAAVQPRNLKMASNMYSYVYGGRFTQGMDITGFDAHPGAILPVAAQRESDDVQPLTLASAPQTIRSLTASFSTPRATGVPGTITVLDGAGLPIAGVQVRRSSDDSIVGYTDLGGTVALTQDSGSTEGYYANADDDATYAAGDGDVSALLTSPAYIPVPTTVVPEFASGQDFRIGDYDQGDITVQVLDQDGSPLPGVEASYAVYRSGDPAPAATTATTDNDGVVTVAFDPATAGPGTYTLAYSAPGSTDLTDQATFTVEADPVATTVVPQFADGHVFDTDEYAAGDISLQIKDQYGDEFSDAGAEIAYWLYPSGAAPGEPIVGTTDRGGRIDVPFDPTTPGTYTLAYGDLGSTSADHTETFTVGNSTLSLTPASGSNGSAASGGAITYTGVLALGEDPLPGRAIDLTYTTDADGTSGLGADRDATATAITDENDTFTVTVQDGNAAAPGSPVEIGTLTATTADNVVGPDSTLTGNANESASATVRFVAASLPPAPSGAGGGGGTAPSPSPTPTTTPTPKPTPTPTPKPTPGPTPAAPAPIHLSGSGDKGAEDRLRIVVSPDFAGRKVVLRRLVHGHWVRTASGRIDAHGVLVLDVRDRNHGRSTTYKVTLLPDASHPKSTSNVVTLS